MRVEDVRVGMVVGIVSNGDKVLPKYVGYTGNVTDIRTDEADAKFPIRVQIHGGQPVWADAAHLVRYTRAPIRDLARLEEWLDA